LGNVVNPHDVIDKYGVDPLRFYLSHEIPVGRDGDFSWERFGGLYDAKLRNDLGNLLNRVLVLLKKEGSTLDSCQDPGFLENTWREYSRSMDTFELNVAVTHAISIATRGNKFVDEKKPWKLQSHEKVIVLSQLAEALRHAALMLLPFIPETAQKIAKQLNVPYAGKMLDRDFVITSEMKQWGGMKNWKTVGEPEILFPPIP